MDDKLLYSELLNSLAQGDGLIEAEQPPLQNHASAQRPFVYCPPTMERAMPPFANFRFRFTPLPAGSHPGGESALTLERGHLMGAGQVAARRIATRKWDRRPDPKNLTA